MNDLIFAYYLMDVFSSLQHAFGIGGTIMFLLSPFVYLALDDFAKPFKHKGVVTLIVFIGSIVSILIAVFIPSQNAVKAYIAVRGISVVSEHVETIPEYKKLRLLMNQWLDEQLTEKE